MVESAQIAAKTQKATRENSASKIRKMDSSQPVNLLESPVDQVLYLQRTIGNQAVQRLIKSGALQAKLKIGQPGDKYELEGDRVADAVMRMPEPGVRRQVEPEEGEEEETLQTKPLVNQITPLVQVQRQEEPEEEEELQAKATSGYISELTSNLESQIQSLKGGGQPLLESERTFFEPRFGHDFSHVRVHTDAQAAEAAQRVNARAFTVGKDVVFGAGQYAPGTSEGRMLMAHELSHTVQQKTRGPTDSFFGTIYRAPKTKNKPLIPMMELSGSGEIIQVLVLGQVLAIVKGSNGLPSQCTIRDSRDENRRRYWLQIECSMGCTVSFPESGIQAMNRMIPHWQGDLHGIIKGLERPYDQHIFGFFGKPSSQVTPKVTQTPSKPVPEKPAVSPHIEDEKKEEPSEGMTREEPKKGVPSKSPEIEKKNEENKTSITGRLDKDITSPATDKSNSQFTLTVNNPPPGKYYYFRWSVRDANNNAYRMLSVEDNSEVWEYSNHKHAYINTPSLQAMLAKNAGLGCHVLVRVLETDSPKIPSFYHPITEKNSRVFSINFNYLPTPNKEKIASVFEYLKQEKWDVDDLAAKLSDSEMISIELSKRISLISYIAEGYLVGDEDETSIIRLIATTPSQDTESLFNSLNADNGKLYKRLEKVMDGEEYRKFHQILRSRFSETMEPKEALKKAATVVILPWASPGLIHSFWNRRFVYEDVSINDKGKIHIEFWATFLGMGLKFVQKHDFDPNELIGVYFYFEEEEVGAPKGKTIFMPAINFLSLYNKQFRQNLRLLGDVALIGLGGLGVISATTKLGKFIAILELAFGVADVTINEFRSEIAKTEAGKNFLKVWDTVSYVIGAYGMARVALKLPSVFKGLKKAHIEFKESKPNLKPSNLKKVDDSVNDVLKKADDAANEAKKAAKAEPPKVPESAPPKTPPRAVARVQAALGDKATKIIEKAFGKIDVFNKLAQRIQNIKKPTLKNVNSIKTYFDKMGYSKFPENKVMLKRLEDIAKGKIKPEKVDIDFMQHELLEKELVEHGIPKGYKEIPGTAEVWDPAHDITRKTLGVDSVYHPEAIKVAE